MKRGLPGWKPKPRLKQPVDAVVVAPVVVTQEVALGRVADKDVAQPVVVDKEVAVEAEVEGDKGLWFIGCS
jgi:hypothetical protein